MKLYKYSYHIRCLTDNHIRINNMYVLTYDYYECKKHYFLFMII